MTANQEPPAFVTNTTGRLGMRYEESAFLDASGSMTPDAVSDRA